MLKNLINITNRKIILPFYHVVSNNAIPHIGKLYSIRSVKTFQNDLDFFCKYYEPISVDRLFKIVQNNLSINKPVFHLSFDDGLKEFYTIIAPILEKRGIPATVFLNNDFLDNKELFYRYKLSLIINKINEVFKKSSHNELLEILDLELNAKNDLIQTILKLNYNDQDKIAKIAKIHGIDFCEYLKQQEPYLKNKQVEDLIKRGFTIGSHSLDHPFFKDIDLKAQKEQIEKSFKDLENKFNIQNKYFSFPFSDEKIGKEFFNWLYQDEKCKLSFGISGLKDDISKFHLHRIPMENSSHSAKTILQREYIYFIAKAIIGKNKIRR